jgi:signal transduction histidine kinase
MSSATGRTPPERSSRPQRTVTVSFSANEIADVSAQLSEITQRVSAALTGVRTTVQLFDQPNRLRTVAASVGSATIADPAVFANDAGIAGWVAGERTATFVPNVTRDSRFLSLGGAAERGALLCLPLIDEYACYGTLTARADLPSHLAPPIQGMLDFAARCAAMELTKFRQMTMLDALSEASMHSTDPRAHTERVGSLMHELLRHRVSFIVTQETDQTRVRVFAHESTDSDSIQLLHGWALHLFDDLRANKQSPLPAVHAVHGYTVLAVPLVAGGTLIGLVCYCDTAPFGQNVNSVLCTRLIAASMYQEVLLRQLHEEKQRFSAVFSRLQEGILILNNSGTTILEANPAFYDAIGVSAAEMPLPLTMLAMEGHWSLQEHVSPVNDSAMVRRWEIRPTALPDRVLAVTDSPVLIGTSVHRVWIIHDITAMSRIERTRSEFMRVVSHELRSPFASLYGYMSILSMEKAGPLTPMQRESLRVMRLSIRQLWRLIEDINELVQSDKGELVLQRETVDVIELIRATVTSVMPLLQANAIRCEFEIEAPIPMMQIDPVRFHQILTNLINNAIKFSDPGAVVAVRAYAARGDVYVSVRDSGPGVAPEEREQIFERFAKGQQTPHHDKSGLGIGLAVVRELVSMHGGRVWVESAPEGGSIFTFTLPITPNE